MRTKKIYIMEVTQEEAQDIYNECVDMIVDGNITFECFAGAALDLRSIRLELKDDVEKFGITSNDAGVTLEIVTKDYIMMHDIETANEVRCLL